MRTLRTIAAAGAAALLTLTTVGTVSAADADACTGLVEFGAEGMTWSATDPRLSGEATGSGGWSFYAPAGEDIDVPTSGDRSYIIINEDGSWSCASSDRALPEPGATDYTLVFSGTGDYEGLTAYVRIDWTEYPFGFSGVILEGGVPEDTMLQG